MRIGIFAVLIALVCAAPAPGQEVSRRWPAPQPLSPGEFVNDHGTYAVELQRQMSESDHAGGTLWLRGALIGGGVGVVLGGVAALVPANVTSDGDPAYISEYTFIWGGIGLLIGGALGAAIGNEYERR